MLTFINPVHFQKAIAYVNQTFFSKPFTITPVCDRWFNQYALAEFNHNHEVLPITREHLEIILDNDPVSDAAIDLVTRYYSKRGSHHAETKEEEDFYKARALYESIVARGKLQIKPVYAKQLTQIIYRPNHGLAHSVRTAYLITAIYQFYEVTDPKKFTLSTNSLEKLQLMMLFSVVGRRDETGFSDINPRIGILNRQTYESFRATSGLEYVAYCKAQAQHLYPPTEEGMEDLYRDGIVVELMGYGTVEAAIAKSEEVIQSVLIAYLIQSNKARDEAAARVYLTENESYLELFFSAGHVRKKANQMLDMMNNAHAMDLPRCYHLFALEEGQPHVAHDIKTYLEDTGFLRTPSLPSLTTAYQLWRCSFDALAVTGHQTTFGLISTEEFNKKKEGIVAEILALNKIPNATLNAMLQRYLKQNQEPNRKFTSDKSIIQYLVANIVINALVTSPLEFTMKALELQQAGDIASPKSAPDARIAANMFAALESLTPYPGLSVATPVIVAVKHGSTQVRAFFDNKHQARLFLKTYEAMFGVKPFKVNVPSKLPEVKEDRPGACFVEMDTLHYQQLLEHRLIQFKEVTTPKVVSRENMLIDQQGHVEALDLVHAGYAVGRLLSTTALNNETFPDYAYFFDALEHPTTQRYTPNKTTDEIRTRVYDPRNAEVYRRTVVAYAPLRFQEPETEPVSLQDKLAQGWTVGPGNGPKNTVFIKKLAHTLLPTHGMVHPFEGYLQQSANYFPIGVMSDIRQVDIKDNRYSWTQNMATQKRFWLQEPSAMYTQRVYAFLHGKKIQKEGVHLNVHALQKTIKPNKENLLAFLEDRVIQWTALLDERHWRPENALLRDFLSLLDQERAQVFTTAPHGLQKKVNALYQAMKERLLLEKKRKSAKYATHPQKVSQEKEKKEFNEILLCNTKTAVRALYATKDTLFDRLNLMFHALQIKQKYGYDVPLLVFSADKPPYHYSEACITQDLMLTYQRIKDREFPFDTTNFPVYAYDKSQPIGPGRYKLRLNEHGEPILQVDEAGNLVFETKNKTYQEQLLLAIFRIGYPGLQSLEAIDAINPGSAIQRIVKTLDLIGGAERESALSTNYPMETSLKEHFFVRTVALGHTQLLADVLSRNFLKPSLTELAQGMQLALEQGDRALHLELSTVYEKASNGIKKLQDTCYQVQTVMDGPQRAMGAIKLYLEYRKLPIQDSALGKILEEMVLNPSSSNQENRNCLDDFIELLAKDNDLLTTYGQISNNTVLDLTLILKAKQYGPEAMANILRLCEGKGVLWAEYYVSLLPHGDYAQSFYQLVVHSPIKKPEEVQALIKSHCHQLVESTRKKLAVLAKEHSEFKALIEEYCRGFETKLEKKKLAMELFAVEADLTHILKRVTGKLAKAIPLEIALEASYERYIASPLDAELNDLMASYQALAAVVHVEKFTPMLYASIVQALPALHSPQWQALYAACERSIDEYCDALLLSRRYMDPHRAMNKEMVFEDIIGSKLFNPSKNFLELSSMLSLIHTSTKAYAQTKVLVNILHLVTEQLASSSANVHAFFSNADIDLNQSREAIEGKIKDIVRIYNRIPKNLLTTVLTDTQNKDCVLLQEQLMACIDLVPENPQIQALASSLSTSTKEKKPDSSKSSTSF